MKKEERFCITYISKKDGSTKKCYPQSREKKDEQMAICKERGIKVLKCEKLYPFNTYKNQHNFELINNICYIAIHEMLDNERPWDEAEFDRLEATKEKAEKYFCYPLPIAWVPYTEWKEMKELSETAIIHRQNACIEAGRPELVALCAQ